MERVNCWITLNEMSGDLLLGTRNVADTFHAERILFEDVSCIKSRDKGARTELMV